jgi:hypothetical protein
VSPHGGNGRTIDADFDRGARILENDAATDKSCVFIPILGAVRARKHSRVPRHSSIGTLGGEERRLKAGGSQNWLPHMASNW